MVSSRWILLVAPLLAGSFAASASADPTHTEPAPHADAPVKPFIRTPTVPKPFLAPVVHPVAPLAPATIPAPAPPMKPAIVLPAGRPQPAAKHVETAAAPGTIFTLKPESSDPGIKIRAQSGNRVVVQGVAAGPKVKYLDGIYFENGKRVQPVDYQVARGVSFQVDHEKMPDFSQDDGYTRKNAWYFAHLATTGTEQGDTALAVAQRLASSLNKGGAYKATVEPTDDGSAAINLEKL